MFIAFGDDEAWRMIKKKLVVVNGDDLVFKARSKKIKRWKKTLPMSGFVINSTKTSEHQKYFTLNSKLFRQSGNRVKKVHHLLPKGIFRKVNIKKTPDCMAAYASVVRENVAGIGGRLYKKTVKYLTRLRKKATIGTSAKSLVATTDREYRAYCGRWKHVERLCYEQKVFNPLREKKEGGTRMHRIPKAWASEEEIKDSPFLVSYVRFHKKGRPLTTESNDFKMTEEHFTRLTFLGEHGMRPRYEKREKEKGKDIVWGLHRKMCPVWPEAQELPNESETAKIYREACLGVERLFTSMIGRSE